MGLKQISEVDRISFLRKFTKELLFFYVREHENKISIEAGRISQKYSGISSDDAVKVFSKTNILEPPRYSKQKKEEEEIGTKRKPIIHRAIVPDKLPVKPIAVKDSIHPIFSEKKPTEIVSRSSSKIQIKGYGIAKVKHIFMDPAISSIECPGPGKNLLVKKYDQVNIIKAVLSQKEINDIITAFSEKARIPIAGGILKAAVDDTIISAVISEFVGSRFIINRQTPYSLIEGREP